MVATVVAVATSSLLLIHLSQLFLIFTTHHIAKQHQAIKVMAIVKTVSLVKISFCLFLMERLFMMKMANKSQISSALEQHSLQHAVDMVALETLLSLHQSVAHQVLHSLVNQVKSAGSLSNLNLLQISHSWDFLALVSLL